jgi:6-phosphogluconolactonase
MPHSELIVYEDPEKLAAAAAERIFSVAVESIAARGRFSLCLTGGSTPRRTYELLARTRHAERNEYDLWPHTYLFFGDERFVPPDDNRSNYQMVRQSLLQNAPVPEDHVFAVPTHSSPQQAAEEYAGTLKGFFGDGIAWPEFDLVLLGLGDDGHTASLFPGAAALHVADRWVTSSPPGVLPPAVDRVTLTFPVFNAARQVVFLVSGANKAAVLAEVYRGRVAVEQRPAVGIRPARGGPVWLADRAAAGRLAGT